MLHAVGDVVVVPVCNSARTIFGDMSGVWEVRLLFFAWWGSVDLLHMFRP